MQLSFLKNNIIDQVVWLGTGDCAKTDLPFSSKTKLHLVDADEAIIQRLHKRFKQQKNVIIHALLIAQNNQNADFKHYSLSEFNGIAEPAALKQYYPGLKQLKVENKPAKSITAFIAEIDLSTQQNNTIIFDLPGLSATLIQTLLNENTLHQFNTLIISISKQPLFKDEPQANDLIQQLEKNGFLCQIHQSNAQDYAIIQAQLNPLHNAITATNQQLVSTQVELKNNQSLLSKTQKQLEQLTQENKTANKHLAETIAQLTQARDHKQKRKDEEKAENQNLIAEIEQYASRVTELEQQLHSEQENLCARREQIKKLESENAEYLQQIKTLTQAKETHKQEREQAKSERDIAKEARDQATKERNEYKSAKEQKEKTLDELQAKISTLQKQNQQLEWKNHDINAQQQSLITELTKAEAQINLIKDIFLQSKPFQRPKGE